MKPDLEPKTPPKKYLQLASVVLSVVKNNRNSKVSSAISAMDSSSIAPSVLNGSNSTQAYWWYQQYEQWGRTLVIIIQVAIACFAVVANSLTLTAFYQNRKLRTPSNTILASLATADLLVAIVTILISIVGSGSDSRINILTYLQIFMLLPILSSVCHLLCISIDRFLAIFLPLRYSTLMSFSLAKTMIGLTWGACAVLCLFFMLWPLFGNTVSFYKCMGIIGPSTVIVVVTSMFCMYLKIWCIAKAHHSAVSALGTLPETIVQNKTALRNTKATRKITFILLAFIVMWTPNTVLLLLLTRSEVTLSSETRSILTLIQGSVATSLVLGSSCLNVFIYARTSSEFRDGYAKVIRTLVCCSFERCKNSQA